MTQEIYIRTRSRNDSGNHTVDIMDNKTCNFVTYEHRYLSVAKGVAQFIFEQYPYEEPTNNYHAIMSYHHRSGGGKSMAEIDADRKRESIKAEETRLLNLLHKRRLSIKQCHKNTQQESNFKPLMYFIGAIALFAALMNLAKYAP